MSGALCMAGSRVERLGLDFSTTITVVRALRVELLGTGGLLALAIGCDEADALIAAVRAAGDSYHIQDVADILPRWITRVRSDGGVDIVDEREGARGRWLAREKRSTD